MESSLAGLDQQVESAVGLVVVHHQFAVGALRDGLHPSARHLIVTCCPKLWP